MRQPRRGNSGGGEPLPGKIFQTKSEQPPFFFAYLADFAINQLVKEKDAE